MTKKLRLLIVILPLLLVLVSVLGWRGAQRTPVSVPVAPIKKDKPTLTVRNFNWGNAENSAAQDGTGFFDRERRQQFAARVAPQDKPFVIELLSRAVLPEPGLAAAESILSNNPNQIQTVYLQFTNQLDEPQREELTKAGLELIRYIDGRAWMVRGTAENLRVAIQNGTARAVAAIDPRDKMNPEVFARRVPIYAQPQRSAEGARFNIIAQPGTKASDFPGLDISELAPSVLGARFGVELSWDGMKEFAAADGVRYIGYATPPVVSRDATLDDTSNVTDVRDSAPNLTGAGVKVAVREIGRPTVHMDMDGQFESVETSGEALPSEIRHASAVSGVVASKGVVSPTAKGVAPGAKVLTYALNEDPFGPSDIVDAGKRGARISNHSYGPAQLTVFGDYDPLSADTDKALRENDLIGFYAGNEETGNLFKHIDFYCGAKNTICVTMNTMAAHAGDDNPTVTPKAGISPFAEHGPMNDGRIKPDLTAFGDSITLIMGLNETYTSVGTSFSCPGVSGMTALLFEHYGKVVGRAPSGALAKAILLNSATDVGNAGPDATNGFGIANIEAAVNLVSARQTAQVTPLAEGVAKTGSNTAFTVNVNNAPQLRVTLCWMDVPGNPAVAKALVNDLDLELVSPSGTTFFPFSLSAASPEAVATATGANTVDTVEQTVVTTPENGAWTLRVKGTNVAVGPQPYALAISGGTFNLDVVPLISASPNSGAAPLAVSFSATGSSGTILSYTWDFGDGATQTGADLTTISHTYTTPGVYFATVTMNDSASAAIIIRVNKTAEVATVKTAKVTLSFKVPAGFEDDQISFSLKATGLLEDKDTVKAKLKSGAYQGLKMFVNIGGGENRVPEPARVFSVELDARGQARADKNSLKYNPKTGEVKVSVKEASLEDLFATLGLTRNTASTGRYNIPIEIETETSIYRAVVPVDYKVTTRAGMAKQAKQ